ncbi:MAG: ABC transporter ATP-binding protein [Fusobacteria bacterium]|nr:ABC transporter ATP-binding protein [Fusobacteriota bacterium]
MNSEIILKLENVSKSYKEKTEKLEIIRSLNMEVYKGEFLSILGKSGSGKSTLLNLIGMLDTPDTGKIFYNGNEVKNIKESERDKMRNRTLGFVFQFHYLLPEFTALENVMLPALISNFDMKINIEKKAKLLLNEMELGDRFTHKPSELSGGEKQRIAIARALINNPSILLADEPTGNLDEETSGTINNIFKKINTEMNQTIIVVTHSNELASKADKKMYLKKGKIEEVF